MKLLVSAKSLANLSKPSVFQIRDLPDSIRRDAEAFDTNGDGIIDGVELGVLLEKHLQSTALNNLFLRIIYGLIVVAAVLICALTGSIYGIVNLVKDTQVSGNGQLQTRSGDQVLVGNSDFCVLSSNGHAVRRNHDGSCPAKSTSGRRLTTTTADAGSEAIKTASTDFCITSTGAALARNADGSCPTSEIDATAIKIEPSTRFDGLSSWYPDEFYDALLSVKLTSPYGVNVRLNVNGYIRQQPSLEVPAGSVTLITRYFD